MKKGFGRCTETSPTNYTEYRVGHCFPPTSTMRLLKPMEYSFSKQSRTLQRPSTVSPQCTMTKLFAARSSDPSRLLDPHSASHLFPPLTRSKRRPIQDHECLFLGVFRTRSYHLCRVTHKHCWTDIGASHRCCVSSSRYQSLSC